MIELSKQEAKVILNCIRLAKQAINSEWDVQYDINGLLKFINVNLNHLYSAQSKVGEIIQDER